ncbi:MAG: FprA family A-type flavoprotein [Oscillospiraceae bacterium]
MGAKKAIDNIYYVGVLDKNLRTFDIIMHTDYGTTYNSYIVKGKDKTVLFETSKEKFFDEHLANIREVCDPADIDYIVVNHTEPDHTGTMRKLLQYATKAEVLGSATAINFLKEIVNEPFPHRVVTDKDTVDLGGMALHFIAAPMLHWPDSMYTYIPELQALFTCDSFGCHYADDKIFNDEMHGDFTHAYKYYFDNIIGPYKNPHMINALNKIKDLDIRFIGNGHGPVLRSDIQKYLEMYENWCYDAPHDKRVAIAFVSAYGFTKLLAQNIAKGIEKGGIENVEIYDLNADDPNAAKSAILASDGFLLGSPTLVGDALPPVYEMLIGLNPIIHKNKFAAAFGSYAWSGEAVPNITARMEQLRFKMPLQGMRVRLKPTQADLDAAVQYGIDFAKAMLG